MISIIGKEHDLGGGFKVRRILPQVAKRQVGPFVFLDHMGPVTAAPKQNIDVRPHPHIGLSTLTYLFDGHFAHRDSLGNEQVIEPGEVNWMTAGAGISHSERTPESLRHTARLMHGLQFWVALPDDKEDCEPDFTHYDSKSIPFRESDDHKMSLVAGEGFGLRSPVKTTSPLVFATFQAKRNHQLQLHAPNFELALYMVNGEAESQGTKLSSTGMLVFDQDQPAQVNIKEGSRFVVIGGEPFKTPRHMWWNLVSSSKAKIEATKKRWKEGSFPMVPGETEFIPLPET
jgi:redox-sensitive bicupin YhaK (pirin superfamily)